MVKFLARKRIYTASHSSRGQMLCGYLFFFIAPMFFSGCIIQREPGPAERIGRSIDEIRKGIAELAPDETPEERRIREDREWRKRQDEYYQRNPKRDEFDSSNDYQRREPVENPYRDSNEFDSELPEKDDGYWDDSPYQAPAIEDDRY
jgi:hypothetical protein